MTWKKLAFTDEIVTNPATSDMDMAGHDLVNCFGLVAAGDASQLDIRGGENHAGSIACFGKTHATTAYRGDIRFYVPNAAGATDLLVMTINGLTDTPNLELYWDLDMNQKEISAMAFENLATAPHAATEVQGEAYYNTVDDHLHIWVV